MARIGLQNIKYAILNDTETYGTAKSIGKAVSCAVSLNLNSAELYADDALAESDYTFASGTATLTIANDDDIVMAELLGRTIGTDGEIIRTNTDVAPFVGLGRIITKIVNGAYKYKVEFLSKVKFQDTMPDENTKGASVEFGTTQIEGTVAVLSDGTWSKTNTFDTMASAQAYLDSCFAPTV